jgi:hypothetical protein
MLLVHNHAASAAWQHVPCLSAAFQSVLAAQTGAGAHSSCSSNAAASNCVTTRSIGSNSKEFDPDDKLGRPTTPWVRQVISGVDLMRHPKYNKGGAHTHSD